MKIKKLQRLLKRSGVNRLVIEPDGIKVERDENYSDDLPVADGYHSHTTDSWYFADEDQLKAFLKIQEEDDGI